MTKYFSRTGLESHVSSLKLHDQVINVLGNSHDNGVENLKGALFGLLATEEFLEDAQDWLELILCDNGISSSGDDGCQQTSGTWDVSSRFPDCGQNERSKKSLVVVRQGAGRVGLQQRGEELEDVGNEFCRMLVSLYMISV